MSALASFHFIRPLWLLAFVPVVLLLAWFVRRRRNSGQWSVYVEQQLWDHVLIGFTASRSKTGLSVMAAIATLSILALAGPSWERLPQPVFKTDSALVIALDLSKSMDAQDIKPSRVDRARLKIRDILKRRSEGQTALVVYAAQAFTVIPLTDDVNTIRAQLESLSTHLMPAQGSRADHAVDEALKLLTQSGVAHGHVLLISDGIDAGSFIEARNRLRSSGHQLSILGVGTPEGSPIPADDGGFVRNRSGGIVIAKLNEPVLRSLATYSRLTVDDRDIDHLLPDTNPSLLSQLDDERANLKTDTWQDMGPWLLLPVLVLASLAFRRGVLLSLCLLLPLMQPQPAQAQPAKDEPAPARSTDAQISKEWNWQSLWKNENQRGREAYDNEKYDEASELFKDPQWRASAAYKRGDYETAAKTLEGIDTSDAWYNRGNALARSGKVQQAIDAYEHALKLDPDNEDAHYNRELLKKQQQKSQQKDKKSDRQPNSDKGDRQSDQGQGQADQDQSGQPQQSSGGSEQGDQNSSGDNPQQTDSNANNQSDQSSKDQQQDSDSQSEKSQNDSMGQPEDNEAEQSQQQAPAFDQEDAEKNGQQSALMSEAGADEKSEEQQQLERQLRRVPDDPGELLRRKFLYQYRQRQPETEQEQW